MCKKNEMENNTSVKKSKQRITSITFKLIYFCIMIFSVVMCYYMTMMVKSLPDHSASEIKYIENWTVIDEAGNSFQTGRKYDDNRAYTEDFTIVSTLPRNIGYDSVLCFRNRSDAEVYINGELRKDFKRARDTAVPGGAVKEFYMTVPLSVTDQGAEIRIVRGKTDWNPEVVPETFVTSTDGVNDYLGHKYGVSFCLDVVLLVASTLVTIIGIAVVIWKRHSIDMLYGALGILNISCWLLAVSQLTPIITGVFYVDGVMGFLLCMMMPFPLLIYLNSIQKGRYRICHASLFVLSVVNFIVWSALHFMKIRSFQLSLITIDSVLAVVIIGAFVTLSLDAKKGYVMNYPYTACGFLVFIVMSIVEIIFLIFFPEISNEVPMLIGLMFLLVFVVIQQFYDFRVLRESLEKEIYDKTVETEQMLIHIVKTLAGTIDAKDTYTKGHSSRVADYSKEIAKRYGYSESAQNDIYMIGLLHDIGKIGIPDAVINKPSKLTDEEYEVIKKHPLMGANILRNIKEMPQLAWGARCHHEKYDGSGYPDHIEGDDIPEQARIIAVADAYDAMTSYRSYRDPMPQKRVRAEIEKGRGSQFDPQFANIMLEMIAEDKNYDMREKKTEE